MQNISLVWKHIFNKSFDKYILLDIILFTSRIAKIITYHKISVRKFSLQNVNYFANTEIYFLNYNARKWIFTVILFHEMKVGIQICKFCPLTEMNTIENERQM